jgi:ribosomal protein L40E
MSTCSSCTAPLAAGARFCRSCGAAVEGPGTRPSTPTVDAPRCRSCGAELAPGARFCRACGADRNAADPPPGVPVEPATAVLPSRAGLVQAPGPPATRRSRAGFVALISVLVLVFGAVGGGAAYLVVLEPDDDEPATFPSSEVTAAGGGGGAGGAEPVVADRSDGAAGGAAAKPAGDARPNLLPDVPRAEMEDEIATLLLAFHEAVVDGRGGEAWEVLSARKQRQIEREDGFAAWIKAQSSLEPYLDPTGLRASIEDADPETGVARVLVTGMSWSEPGAGCSEWAGLTWVKYEDGDWRYDPGYSTTGTRERIWKPRFEELLGGGC